MKPNLLDFHLFPVSDWRQLKERLAGGNARHILIVIEQADKQTELTDYLGKILSAAKVNLQEDTLLLILTKGENISFSDLARAHPVRQALLFGIAPRQLGLHFSLPPGQLVAVGERAFLHADPLASLWEEREAAARPKAAALWKNLKQLFIDMHQ